VIGPIVRCNSLKLFSHAARELKDALNAQGVLRILLGIEQQRGLYAGRCGDEFAD
jgi:hypothetical protein